MSMFLKCFGSKRNSQSDSSVRDGKVTNKKSKKKKCRCGRSDQVDDLTDGKTFSKTLPISLKSQSISSCCENDSDGSPEHYTVISTTVDPASANPFLRNVRDPNLPAKSYMPVSKNDPNYNMNHPRRGKAIIFNFDRWENTTVPDLALPPRLGSQKDKKDLAKCLRKLDFEVEEHDNVESRGENGIWEILKKVKQEDHTDADCLVVVVMTHGEKNTVYMRDGAQIPINLIWQDFEADKCPSLAGKPKIFIVQACRGKQYDSGTKLHHNSHIEEDHNRSDVTDASTFSYVIPNAADILVAFSCPLGHYSWRHPERGSWFIQAICKVFNKHAHQMDLQMLFTTVAREVALNYESNTVNVESNNKKQVTSTSSTLIRTVMFKPKTSHPYRFAPLAQTSHLAPVASIPFPLPIAQEIAVEEEGPVTLQSIVNATTTELEFGFVNSHPMTDTELNSQFVDPHNGLNDPNQNGADSHQTHGLPV